MINHSFVELYWSFPDGSAVKNPPAIQEIKIQSLGREDPLGEDLATNSRFLPKRSHRQRSLMGYSPKGSKESDVTKQLSMSYISVLLIYIIVCMC